MKRHSKAVPQERPTAKPEVRKNHKEALRLNAQEAERNKKHPEPMTLMNKLAKEGSPPSPKGLATLGQIEKAASAMAQWDNSDPFSYGRTALHVRQGYLRSDEVIKEMGQRTLARRAAKIREVDNEK